jgi:hypothetical protein
MFLVVLLSSTTQTTERAAVGHGTEPARERHDHTEIARLHPAQ